MLFTDSRNLFLSIHEGVLGSFSVLQQLRHLLMKQLHIMRVCNAALNNARDTTDRVVSSRPVIADIRIGRITIYFIRCLACSGDCVSHISLYIVAQDVVLTGSQSSRLAHTTPHPASLHGLELNDSSFLFAVLR